MAQMLEFVDKDVKTQKHKRKQAHNNEKTNKIPIRNHSRQNYRKEPNVNSTTKKYNV